VGQCVRTATRVWRAPLDVAISASLYRLRQSTVRGEIRATHYDILPCLSPHFSLSLRDGRPFGHRTICPKTCLKICGWDGFEGVAGFFFVFAMRSPGPASRQPLIVSNRLHRLTLVRADLHENPNRSAKEESRWGRFSVSTTCPVPSSIIKSNHAGNTDPSQRPRTKGDIALYWLRAHGVREETCMSCSVENLCFPIQDG